MRVSYRRAMTRYSVTYNESFKLWDSQFCNLYTLLSFILSPLQLFMQSQLLRLIFSPVPPSSGVLSAGEAPQCQPGLSELQWAEPAAAAFSPAAADHADWEHYSHLWAGGESEPSADTGWLKTVKNRLKHQVNKKIYIWKYVQHHGVVVHTVLPKHIFS